MISFYHYRKYRKHDNIGTLDQFVTNGHLRRWFDHFCSWSDHADLIVKYEDLKSNKIPEFKKIIKMVGINANHQVLKTAVERSKFENIKSIEEKSHGEKEKKERFARSGETGQWKSYFSDELRKYFTKLKTEYNIKVY
jgi:hypothetical protein